MHSYMDPQDQQHCERECTRLCQDFAWTVDHCDYAGFVELFAADGTFERMGQHSVGHVAIREFLDARPRNRVTRHICSNIRIDVTGPDTATGTCSALMFAASFADESASATPLPISSPVVVDYLDNYVLTDHGWKIQCRRTKVVFQP
jgi:uncharacterized protein (TIGR02246 family)